MDPQEHSCRSETLPPVFSLCGVEGAVMVDVCVASNSSRKPFSPVDRETSNFG